MVAIATLVMFALLSSVGIAQTSSQQPAPESKSCPPATAGSAKTPPEKPCTTSPPVQAPASERFPYPGEAPAQPADKPATSSTQAPQPAGVAKQFPYPGEASSSSSSSGSSSGSSDSSSSSRDGSGSDVPAPDTAAHQGSVRRKLPKIEHLQSDEDRESEDLTVAKFYRQSGDLRAAYLRTKDAVKVQPDDPEAHFALADAAQHLNKKEEAVAEYNAYLKLEPDGDRVNAAQKALATLK